MKKLLILCTLIGLTACDSPESCTPKNAAKYFLYISGNQEDIANPATINYVIETHIGSVKNTGYKSPYYGTPICEITYKKSSLMYQAMKQLGYETICYLYIPQKQSYEHEPCSNNQIGR